MTTAIAKEWVCLNNPSPSTDLRYSRQEIISEGPTSVVTRIESESQLPDGPRFVAVKTSTTSHAKEPHDIIKEVRLLASLSHPNVCYIVLACLHPTHLSSTGHPIVQTRTISEIPKPELLDAIHPPLSRRAPRVLQILPTPHHLLWKHNPSLTHSPRTPIHCPYQVDHLSGPLWGEPPPQ